MKLRLLTRGLLIGVLASALSALPYSALADNSATISVPPGSLQLVPPTSIDFGSLQLNGTDLSPSASVNLIVNDLTGSGGGWKLTGSSVTFAATDNNAHKLPTDAFSITPNAQAIGCAYANNCVVPVPSFALGPISIPAGDTPPTPVVIFNAAPNSGMGSINFVAAASLFIPAQSFAGNYNSVLTLSLTSGP